MQNESPLDYHKRIVYGKLVDKTLADLDYTEIAELIYGKPYASDVARRMLYGSRATLELLDRERVDSTEDCDVRAEIDAKMFELQKERQRFFDQRREFNKLVAKSGREDHLYDTLLEAAGALCDTVGKLYDGSVPELYTSDSEAVLVLADWHYGMTTDNVFNKYNKEICKERVRTVVESAKKKLMLHKTAHRGARRPVSRRDTHKRKGRFGRTRLRPDHAGV